MNIPFVVVFPLGGTQITLASVVVMFLPLTLGSRDIGYTLRG